MTDAIPFEVDLSAIEATGGPDELRRLIADRFRQAMVGHLPGGAGRIIAAEWRGDRLIFEYRPEDEIVIDLIQDWGEVLAEAPQDAFFTIVRDLDPDVMEAEGWVPEERATKAERAIVLMGEVFAELGAAMEREDEHSETPEDVDETIAILGRIHEAFKAHRDPGVSHLRREFERHERAFLDFVTARIPDPEMANALVSLARRYAGSSGVLAHAEAEARSRLRVVE